MRIPASVNARCGSLMVRAMVAVVLGLLTTFALAFWFGYRPAWDNPRIVSAHLTPLGASEAAVHIAQAQRAGAVTRLVRIFSADENRWLEIDARLPESAMHEVAPDDSFDGSSGAFGAVMKGQPGTSGFREEARGWPLLALWCWTADGDDADPVRYRGGVNLSDPNNYETRGRVMPLLPIWSGLALDTALFAGAWLLLGWGPRGLRRIARLRRKGVCGGCGYPLTPELERCPECGKPNRLAAPAH